MGWPTLAVCSALHYRVVASAIILPVQARARYGREVGVRVSRLVASVGQCAESTGEQGRVRRKLTGLAGEVW